MGQPALKLHSENNKKEDSLKKIKDTHTPELIFAICSYLGTEVKAVSEEIKQIIENDYGYECQIIKLSKFIEEAAPISKSYGGTKEYNRITHLINEGNNLRETYGNDILAELAIEKIGLERVKQAGLRQEDKPFKFKPRRNCYIIESIKNPSEYEIFKEVYRNLFYTLGVFSPNNIRKNNLQHRGMKEVEIAELIEKDAHEDLDHGQNVKETFTSSDFFLRIDNNSRSNLQAKIKRFIHLIFGTEIITPTPDETAMYLATTAAANSACLSRQVGAAITDKYGNLLTLGWNDVPCYGGNLYKHLSKSDIHGEDDNRCMNWKGKCFNDYHKEIISKELETELIKEGFIVKEKNHNVLEKIQKSRLRSLIEFSRSIHAEMHAIIIGSQKVGDKMIGGKLYCTTYPCHNCARHIILAGITEVYYIEPYSKSLAIELHGDSITEEETEKGKVKILLFDGVSPKRFFQLFKMEDNIRKDSEGKLTRKKYKKINPKFTETLEALYTLESTATRNLKDINLTS